MGERPGNRQALQLRAGPLTLLFEPELAFLRYVRLGSTEVLRGIYAAVRDQNWGTVPPRVTHLQVEQAAESFRLSFDVECIQEEIDFAWRGTLTGDASGSVTYRMEGVARSRFRRNRIGFCVLHPASVAGLDCRVEHVDGSLEEGRFPDRIAPHQPFFRIRALTHPVGSGVEAEVRLDGDTFEMEDQRNWTDASFKTYCTPLGLPFPVEVEAGTRMSQSVTLRLRGSAPPAIAAPEAPVEISLDDARRHPLPEIGLALGPGPMTEQQLERLKRLHLGHLRVDLRLDLGDYPARLRQAVEVSAELNCRLHLALHVTDDAEAELRALASLTKLDALREATWLVYRHRGQAVTEPWAGLARRILEERLGSVTVGGGTDAYFTELNRGRPPLPEGAPVSFSLNPQVHAFDDASLLETLEVQGLTVRDAQALYPGHPVYVSPVTLRPRFNPAATDLGAEELSPADPRLNQNFGAAWTLGSLCSLISYNPASITYHETHGAAGVIGRRAPESALAEEHDVSPLYRMFAEVGELGGGEAQARLLGSPPWAAALLLRNGERRRGLVANLTGERLTVRLRGHPSSPEPDELAPYRVAIFEDHGVRRGE
ncbi:MAG: hypothetical protein ACK47B_06960 [Armatimonadota bacterium]